MRVQDNSVREHAAVEKLELVDIVAFDGPAGFSPDRKQFRAAIKRAKREEIHLLINSKKPKR